MSLGRGPEIAVLFVGTLYSSADIFLPVSIKLREIFGSILLESSPIPWNYTDYYGDEIGPPVFRRFTFFERNVDASSIVDAKLRTMSLETDFSTSGRRQINIDPGNMTLAKVVLASRKNYSDRIYLGKGVFGEVELFHKDGIYNPLPYTYPDYREETFLGIFSEARKLLKKSRFRDIGS
jgi:hypothetical protein